MVSEILIGSGHAFVVDLTRHQGDSQSLINSVNRYLRSKYPAGRVTWFARPDQVALLHDGEHVVEENRFGTTANAGAIKELIQRMSRDGADSTVFHVLTYDRRVLEVAASLNELSLIVVPTHMNNIKDDGNGSRYATPRPAFQREPFSSLPVEEGLELTRQILQRGAHTSRENALALAKLRPIMSHLDGRARKNPLDPHSVQLISRIVAEGERRGWLRQFRTNQQLGSEHVWLYDLENQLSFPTEVTSPVIDQIETSAKAAATVSVEDTRGSQETDVPLAEERGSEEVRSLALPQTKLVRRSELMEAKLRERGIGSPAVARDYLFAAVEEIIATGEPCATAQLISKAREQAKRAYETDEQVKEQNWNAIGDCFLRMLLTSEVLLRADESPIRDGIGAYSARVSKLAPNFRDRCEATLLEVVIKKMGDVCYSELFDLGLTLFHRGKESGLPREEIVERTDFLLGLLQQEGRIEIDGEGRLLTTSQSTPAARRLTAVQ